MNGNKSIVSSRNGVVAAAHPLAAQAGARRLWEGGNCFDAIAAAAAALNVVEPYNSGLAGLGVAICWIASESRARVLNFVPPPPLGFQRPHDEDRAKLRRGGPGSGLPMCLAGWSELVECYGKGSLADALEPAIRLARDGFPLIELNVAAIREAAAELSQHSDLYPEFARVFEPDTVALGRILQQPDLAGTLEAIARKKSNYLYGGQLGSAVIDAVNRLGGCFVAEDFSGCCPQWQEPLRVSYRDVEILAPPPPAHGYQFLLTLAILAGFDLSSLPHNGARHLDTVFRAARIAALKRIELDIPDAGALAALFSESSLTDLRRRINDPRSLSGPTEHATDAWRNDPFMENTTSLTAADRDGNMVTITQSLGQYFGSGLIVPDTGVALNNIPYYGDLRATSRHRMRGGYPQATPLAPGLVLKNAEPVLAFGTPGSFGISQTQAQVLVQHVDFGLGLQDAFEAPRGRLLPGSGVQLEGRIAPEIVEELRARGHEVQLGPLWTKFVGGMHGVVRAPDTGACTGAADPRRDGWVAPG